MTRLQTPPSGEGELAALRTARGLTQAALADAAGITRAQLNAIEAGKNGTTIRTILAIAKAMKADPLSVVVAVTRDFQRPRGIRPRTPRAARKSA